MTPKDLNMAEPMKAAELEQIHANIGKLMAETMKLSAEGEKMRRESQWYPFVAGAGFVVALVALLKLFVH